MTNRATSALRLSAVAAVSLLASGCGVFSPVQTDKPYIPADGVFITIPGLALRNLAIVTGSDGGPGVVIGQMVNESNESVSVSFGLEGATTSPTTVVPAGSGDTISDSTQRIEFSSVPVKPGSMTNLTITTRQAGQNVVQVPVLLDNRFYTGLVG